MGELQDMLRASNPYVGFYNQVRQRMVNEPTANYRAKVASVVYEIARSKKIQ